MYNYDQHLHFIGIGGVGMAGIAEVLLNLGYSLSGSDLKESHLTAQLRKLGAAVAIGHHEGNIPTHTTVVVISSAVTENNVELQAARRMSIPVIPRAEMLAELMRMKYGIAVAGSHGKTTTTSMVAKLLRDVGLDPTVIVGGRLLSQETGASNGTGQYLVAESDESDGSFCYLRPAIAVVTNIDREHLGHYGSFGALEEAFTQFMSSVPFYGLVVACQDDPIVAKIAQNLKRRVLYYGLSPESYVSAHDIHYDGPLSCYTLRINQEDVCRVTVPVPGAHMVCNSLAAIAVGLELGAYPAEAANSLQSFPGIARRSEVVGNVNGILFVDDYAHHPTEILATLAALRRGWLTKLRERLGTDTGRLIAVFQPHRYSRTRELFSDFLHVFSDADELFVGDIYAAGEDVDPAVSGEVLAAAIQHPHVHYLPDLAESVRGKVLPTLRPGDVLVGLGAGSVGSFIRDAAAELEKMKPADPMFLEKNNPPH